MTTILVHKGARLVTGPGAIATPATNRDQFRLGDEWRSATDWTNGQQVEQVNHFGRHQTSIGDVVLVRDDDNMELVGQVLIALIRMAEVNTLTEQDVTDMGYNSLADIRARLGERRIWFMRTEPVSSTTAYTTLQ